MLSAGKILRPFIKVCLGSLQITSVGENQPYYQNFKISLLSMIANHLRPFTKLFTTRRPQKKS